MIRFLLLLLLPLPLCATEFAPWFKPLLEPDFQLAWQVEYYPNVDSQAENPKPCIHHSNTLNSLWGSFMISPWFDLNVEFELQGMHSAHSHRTFFDYGKLTARYLWMDDVVGDPFSLATGLSITIPSHRSLREIGAYHLGHTDVELHFAVGKEFCRCPEHWSTRFWLMGGVANSRWDWPQLRLQLFGERNFNDRQFIRIGAEGLINFGSKDLMCPCVFDGYAPIKSRAADVRVRYTYRIPTCGELWMEYRYRFYARNYPEKDSIIRVGLFYPLGI